MEYQILHGASLVHQGIDVRAQHGHQCHGHAAVVKCGVFVAGVALQFAYTARQFLLSAAGGGGILNFKHFSGQ